MHGHYLIRFATRLASRLAAMLLFPLLAEAHPGPGPHGLVDGTTHLLTSPDHLVELLAFGIGGSAIAAIAAVILIRRRRR